MVPAVFSHRMRPRCSMLPVRRTRRLAQTRLRCAHAPYSTFRMPLLAIRRAEWPRVQTLKSLLASFPSGCLPTQLYEATLRTRLPVAQTRQGNWSFARHSKLARCLALHNLSSSSEVGFLAPCDTIRQPSTLTSAARWVGSACQRSLRAVASDLCLRSTLQEAYPESPGRPHVDPELNLLQSAGNERPVVQISLVRLLPCKRAKQSWC